MFKEFQMIGSIELDEWAFLLHIALYGVDYQYVIIRFLCFRLDIVWRKKKKNER